MEQQILQFETGLLELRRLTSTDFAALALYDMAERNMRWACASGSRNERYKRIVLRTGKDIPGTVIRLGRPLLIDSFHPQLGEEDASHYPIVLAEGLRSVAAFPLSHQDRVIGVLLVGNRFDHKFDEETVELMEEAAEQVGSMLGSQSIQQF